MISHHPLRRPQGSALAATAQGGLGKAGLSLFQLIPSESPRCQPPVLPAAGHHLLRALVTQGGNLESFQKLI